MGDIFFLRLQKYIIFKFWKQNVLIQDLALDLFGYNFYFKGGSVMKEFAEFTINDENLPQQKEKVLEKIEENRNAVEKLLENPDKNYSNFVKPYQLMHEELDFLFSPISHLNYVKNSETTEKIYEEILRGTLPELLEHFKNNKPRGEFTIVIGANR